MDFFSFDNASSHPSSSLNHQTNYDFAMSPTMSSSDMMFANSDPAPLHVNPGAMWDDPSQIDSTASLGKLLTNYGGRANQAFGQVTPPEEFDMHSLGKLPSKRADSGVEHGTTMDFGASASPESSNASAARSSSTRRSLKRSRRDSRMSEDEGVQPDGKREKYREKNRVAAAKCRAKKKEHVDHLEENHRAQSVLNAALKQTEKTLRDELSFWRTQALQHTFCSCRPIQDYNMRKAQNLASSGSDFGSALNTKPSVCGIHRLSQSVSGPEALSPTLGNGRRSVSFASPNDFAFQTVGRSKATASSDMTAGTGSFSTARDRDPKGFVHEPTN